MTRMEKYRDYHTDIRQMVESSIVESVIAQESLLEDKKIIWVNVVNEELITVKAITQYGTIWEYLLSHDNGVLTKVGFGIMHSDRELSWYEYGKRIS